MRAGFLLASVLGLAACAGIEEGKLDRFAEVVAEPNLHGGEGDVWSFLYAPKQGFPGAPAVPREAAAASAVRVATGDAHLVFAQVEPNPYRLWAFLDVDGNFDPQVDVLAQPGAGDRVGPGSEINVQPGKRQTFPVEVSTQIFDEPPAFRLEGDQTDVTLSDVAGAPGVVTVVQDSIDGTFDPKHLGFRVGLIDDDGNGVPDDLDGDGAPDLWPRAFMLWQPKPGQAEEGTVVLLPMIFNPSPFLTELNGDPSRSLVVDRLQFAVLSQAQEVTTDAHGKVQTQFRATAPTGSYQLVLYTRTGQYWRLPNDLAATRPTQGVTFHVDRNGR